MISRLTTDELLDEVVDRLARVRASLGPAAFRDAAGRVLGAIGRAAHVEAEKRAARHGPTGPSPTRRAGD
jgi:hypothetical protein